MKKYVTIHGVEVHVGIVAVLCVALMLSTTLAVIYYTKTIDHQASIISSGKIQTYADQGCTLVLNSNNWGNFNASSGDSVKTLDVYVKNEGNVRVNVTWVASGFASYNGTEVQYRTSSWRLYLVKVDGSEVKLRPENDTTPDRVQLLSGEVAHLKLYLTAVEGSAPEDFTFHTTFRSQDT